MISFFITSLDLFIHCLSFPLSVHFSLYLPIYVCIGARVGYRYIPLGVGVGWRYQGAAGRNVHKIATFTQRGKNNDNGKTDQYILMHLKREICLDTYLVYT